MSYYPPPSQGQEYSVNYYPPNPGQLYGNEPPNQYNRPGPFPTDPYGPPGSYPLPEPEQYPPPGQYPPPVQYPPPGQYPPHGQYPPPEQYPPPGQPYGQGFGPVYGNDVIVNQPMPPMGNDWMALPQNMPNCPPGLEYLIPLSSLFVKQKVDFVELVTGFEGQNHFTIKNDKGEKIYWAVEESDVCSRTCCGRYRPFEMSIVNAQKREIIRLRRPLSCCFPCCFQKMEVFAPAGNLLGTIEQDFSFFFPQFSIKNAARETVLMIEGPFCAAPLCGQAEFQVLSKDGRVKVGKISKEWSGLLREVFTDADFFGISFPANLDVRMKAVMLGAVFLIDIVYYERSSR